MATAQLIRHLSAEEQIFTISSPQASSSPIDIHTLIWKWQSSSHSTNVDPVLILLPYWGGSASTFHRIPPLLHPTSSTGQVFSTIISISHRGTGKSAPAEPDEPEAYHINMLASDTVDLLRQFLIRDLISKENGVVLGGHSMGGKVALATAAQLTQAGDIDLSDMLRGVFLMAPAPPSPLVMPPDIAAQQATAYDSDDSVKWTVQNVLSDGGTGHHRMEASADIEAVVYDSRALSPGMKAGWPQVGMQDDIRPGLRNMSTKHAVRVIVGAEDKVEPVDRVSQDTVDFLRAECWPVTLRTLDQNAKPLNGCGHLLPLEAPEWIAEELADFSRSL